MDNWRTGYVADARLTLTKVAWPGGRVRERAGKPRLDASDSPVKVSFPQTAGTHVHGEERTPALAPTTGLSAVCLHRHESPEPAPAQSGAVHSDLPSVSVTIASNATTRLKIICGLHSSHAG